MIRGRALGRLLVLLPMLAALAAPLAAAPGPLADRAAVSPDGLARVMRLEMERIRSLEADLQALMIEQRTIRVGHWVLGRMRAASRAPWRLRAETASARLFARHAAGVPLGAALVPQAPALVRAVLRQTARGRATAARRHAFLDARIAGLQAVAALLAEERAAARLERERVAWRVAQLAWWRAERLPERVASGRPPGTLVGPPSRWPMPRDPAGSGLAQSCPALDSRRMGGC